MAVLPEQSALFQPGLDHFICDRASWWHPEAAFAGLVLDSGNGKTQFQGYFQPDAISRRGAIPGHSNGQ